jgi:CO/xanthine dehydrogenase Mo-binding subunit
MVAVAATAANAVAAALAPLGVEIRKLPLSPARLWQAIRQAEQSEPPGVIA